MYFSLQLFIAGYLLSTFSSSEFVKIRTFKKYAGRTLIGFESLGVIVGPSARYCADRCQFVRPICHAFSVANVRDATNANTAFECKLSIADFAWVDAVNSSLYVGSYEYMIFMLATSFKRWDNAYNNICYAENGEVLEKGGYTLQKDGKYYKYYPNGANDRAGQNIAQCMDDKAFPATIYPSNRLQAWMSAVPSNHNDFVTVGIYQVTNTSWVTADGKSKLS